MDPKFRICGTASLAMDRLRAGNHLRRAMRLHALGLGERALAEYEAALAAVRDGSDTEASEIRGYLVQLLIAMGARSRSVAVRSECTDLGAKVASAKQAAAQSSGMWCWRARASLGRWQGANAQYSEAEVSLREAITEVAAEWGADHLELARYEDDLANVLLFVGRTEEAERWIADARRIVTAAGHKYEHDAE